MKGWHSKLSKHPPVEEAVRSMREAARILGIDEGSLRRWYRRGWWDRLPDGTVPVRLIWQIACDRAVLARLADLEAHRLALARFSLVRAEILERQGELVSRHDAMDAWATAAGKAADRAAQVTGADRKLVFEIIKMTGEDFFMRCGSTHLHDNGTGAD